MISLSVPDQIGETHPPRVPQLGLHLALLTRFYMSARKGPKSSRKPKSIIMRILNKAGTNIALGILKKRKKIVTSLDSG